MTNKGVEIKYGDFAPEAKENFNAVASEQETFVNLEQFKRYNLEFKNFSNPCELYQTVLDGSGIPFPSNPEEYNMGLWSNQLSKSDGTFAEPIVLTLTSEGQYSSQGLTLTFDTYNNIYANNVNIHWWRDADGTLTDLGEKTFYPDNAFYFCHNKVENYNKIVITFYSMNLPYNRLKLRVIDYGYGTVFTGGQLRNTKLIQELDPISTQISINTADFTIDSKSNIEYSFQERQPLSVYFDGKLKATTFVKSSKRKARFLWDIQSEDYIGLMANINFYGGIYEGKDAYELLEEIFNTAKVPYTINENLKGVLLYGYIPFTTCRDALMQVAFAVQNVVDTSNSATVNVFELENDVKQTIPLNRIMQGQNFDDEDTVTAVEIVSHTYKPIDETMDVYDTTNSGTGEEIFVSFSEPLHSLTITNGEILTEHSNYAIINAQENCKLTGKKYEHTTVTKREKNPVVSASEIEKVVAIENATLVSSYNIDMVLDKCYEWLTKVNTTNLKIVEGKHITGGTTPIKVTYDKPVNLGENIKAETEYLGTVSGRIIKQSFNLHGGIIIKEAVLK